MKHLLNIWLALLVFATVADAQTTRRTTRTGDVFSRDSVSVPLQGKRPYLSSSGVIRYITSTGVRQSAAEALGLTALLGGVGSGTAIVTTFSQIQGTLPANRVAGLSALATSALWGDIGGKPAEYPSSFSVITGQLNANRLSNLSGVSISVFSNDADYRNSTQVNTAINNAIGPVATSASSATAVNVTQATALTDLNNNKVDKIAGKGLSTNDFTTVLLNKVVNLPDVTNAASVTAGTFDSARFPNTPVTPGTYGSPTQIPVITVDGKGRITGASSTTFSGGSAAQYEAWEKSLPYYVATKTQLRGHDSTGVLRWFDAVVSAAMSGTTAAPMYGARQQPIIAEYDTTGHNYTVINVSAATETALNNAISAVSSTANRYLKLPADATLVVTGGVNIAGPINNMVIDLNGTDLTCGTGRVGMLNIYQGNIRGLAIVNTSPNPSWLRNTATTPTTNTGYGLLGMYEAANIAGATYNGKVVAGVRLKNLWFRDPKLNMNAIFGNSYSATSQGGNGVGNMHRDVVVEDIRFDSVGRAGYEHLFHRWDDGDTITVEGRNLISRRLYGVAMGIANNSTPKFGPVVSYSGYHQVAGIYSVTAVNGSYSGVEDVGGEDVTFDGNSLTITAANSNATGVSMTRPQSQSWKQLAKYVTVKNNSAYISGTNTTGQPVELNWVYRPWVYNNVGITPSGAKFRMNTGLIGSLDGAANTGNNWRTTVAGTAVLFLPGTYNTYFQYNDVSTVGASSQSQTVGLERDSALDTKFNFVRNNTIRRGNGTVPYIKFYNASGGADLTTDPSNTNTLTPNTQVNP